VQLGAIVDRVTRDDRAALGAGGATELRIPARWVDLQPRAGHWDGETLEALAVQVTDARDAGLGPWLALLGRRTPGWFDDEGGFADSKAASRWWPRYVDGLASYLGGDVAGWFPMIDPAGFAARAFAGRDPDVAAVGHRHLLVAWRDAWRVLRGGPPVATALAVNPWDGDWPRALRTGEPNPTALEIEDLAGSCDLLGAIVGVDHRTDSDQPVEALVRLAGEGPDGPLAVLASLGGDDDDQRATAAQTLATALRVLAGDGVVIGATFTDSLLTADGAPSTVASILAELR
jgi:hypothetical protein